MKKFIAASIFLLALGACADHQYSYENPAPLPSLDKFVIGSTTIEEARKMPCESSWSGWKTAPQALGCTRIEDYHKHDIRLDKFEMLRLSFNESGTLISKRYEQEITKGATILQDWNSPLGKLVTSEIDGVFFDDSAEGCDVSGWAAQEKEFGCVYVLKKSKLWAYPADAYWRGEDDKFVIFVLLKGKDIRLYKYETDETVVLKTASRAKGH
ncbi:MAG: hypothetical protein OEL53_00615 [Rhodospirillales bacterium]|nr:hypothetical protein [Rhodospirillales bacterium]